MNDKTKSYSEMTRRELKQLGADNVGIAMGIQISHHDVTPLEASPRRFWFRIGRLYFDVILNKDSTTSLYISNENDNISIQDSIQIASFRSDGSIIRKRVRVRTT